ncbi:MerR family transcriptional regulator [Bacteriovorax sp. DB6_IX]|uniref:MerR family transcriptional regulator n=1 Tax=Bacteriovorax sp. DB6_IX TaxID=1353530 RepID=UPI000389F74C|nr:MerR family transcriptional regulator [Bacteriovorax sp. DB6_IX]EQC50600.1 MerR HTH family regulatory protein [Bacteriovorax sp. DB6_IX]
MQNEMRIPNKSLFKLDEVCTLTGVKPYVLRFWESEFEQLRPILSSTGQKLFEHKDLDAVMQIKHLLFDKKMTIEQAKFEFDKLVAVDSDSDLEVLDESQNTEQQEQTLAASMEIVNESLRRTETEKLSEAKILLNDIILATESVQRAYNWV